MLLQEAVKQQHFLNMQKKNKHLKILYLAYNKSLQISIQEKLKEYNLSHMKISTIHALAFNKTQAFQYNLCNDLKIQVIESSLNQYEREVNQRTNYYPIPEYIAIIKDLVNFYCNSSLIALDENLLEKYKSQCDLGANTLKLLEKDPPRLLNHLKHILSSMKNKKIDAIHDFI